jgi:hypothetical protein
MYIILMVMKEKYKEVNFHSFNWQLMIYIKVSFIENKKLKIVLIILLILMIKIINQFVAFVQIDLLINGIIFSNFYSSILSCKI